ncbi:sigma 54-interacting transcriptional regulator [Bacillus solimangrovi]|uniref:Sigma-54-dependent Fis family transcriptional regulator n=1 Tax=Bacillus solimangrovi TaxID=1305675 RepID=A0A1E5LKE9_9BACI|nr:sigma 54-interacting transcriptional regulator [Bacillus solimangrovi]OEH94569.1 sigma-54-dependent Fis family transcriptional regulator [Bacillus solimangrovi]
MQNVLIVGAGSGGTAILKMFKETSAMNIVAVVDVNLNAPGLKLAQQWGIQTGADWRDFLTDDVNVIVEATGDNRVFKTLLEHRNKKTVVIPGAVAYITAQLMEEKESLIEKLKDQSYMQDMILNATNDGMVAIDKEEQVIMVNKAAERMMNIHSEQIVEQRVNHFILNSQLHRVLVTKQIEMNQELVLEDGRKVITTKIPLLSDGGEAIGAMAVFKDITEVVELANEITNLKGIQTMLEAIIQSSEEAISVVDEEGTGLMINRAYTRITGLERDEIIGKPATADISEGDSMHMQVLKTRKPVRGVRMKVGPNKKDVIVNVAPVIVDGKIKGSVGVIHDVSEIQELTKELRRARQIIRTLEAKYSFDDIIGESEEMKFAIEQAKLGAKTPATVLLRGESGTGKELFAHAIHNGSDRKYNKFIRVNCAAISENLLESELFGYEEGAFSGAKRGGKLGLFEEANNGSIFLDEIGELSANTQAKLLRVLQENEIVRVGGTKAIPINVRVIAATNVNLERGMAEGTVREDLYYRLNRFPIQIPSLRKRKDDIPALCYHLLQKINQDYGRNVEGITNEASVLFQQYDWPGNVRELENILGRAVINMKFNESVIDKKHIPELLVNLQSEKETEQTVHIGEGNSLAKIVENYEKKVINETMIKCKGNKTKVAKMLNISIRNLYYKLDKLKNDNNDMQ